LWIHVDISWNLWLDIGTQTEGVKMTNQWNDETIDAVFNEVNEDEKYDYHNKGQDFGVGITIEPSDYELFKVECIKQDPELKADAGWE